LALPNVLTALYMLAVGAMMLRHAMWRDEAQAFLIARDSRSLGELLWNMRFEGHPPLWQFLLWIITRFTQRPEAMQALHLLMAAGTVYLVTRFSPYPLLAKILFPFGYYMIFEYGIIARNYKMFVLLLAALCTVWQYRRAEGTRCFVWLGVLLALLALTHVLGLILGAGFGVMLLAESALTPSGRKAVRRHWWRFSVGMLLAAASAAWSVYLLKPPADTSFAIGWSTDFTAGHVQVTRYTLWNGLVPIDHAGVEFWDENILVPINGGGRDPLAAAAFWGPLVAAGCFLLVVTSWRAVLYLLVALSGALTFAHIKMYHLYGIGGGTRHHGVYFIAVLVACWIAWSGKTAWPAPWWRRLYWLPPRLGFTALLGVQAYAAIVPLEACRQYPFSMSRQTADALRPKLGPDDILTGPIDYMIGPVAVYLPGHDVFLADEGQWRSFAYWRLIPPQTRKPTLTWAMQIAREKNRPVDIVYYGAYPTPPGAERLCSVTGPCVQGDETYTVVRIKPPPASAATPLP